MPRPNKPRVFRTKRLEPEVAGDLLSLPLVFDSLGFALADVFLEDVSQLLATEVFACELSLCGALAIAGFPEGGVNWLATSSFTGPLLLR